MTSGVPRTSMPVGRRRRRASGSGRASSRPRAAIFADSTSGWSNGLMPRRRPATAVAYSQTRSCAPRRARTRGSRPRRRARKISSPRVVDEADDLQVGEVRRRARGQSVPSTTGRMPVPSLPVDSAMSCSAQSAKPDDVGAVGDDAELVASGEAGRGDRRAEHEARVLGAVDGERELDRLGLVEELGDVDAGEAGRHEAERGQRRVAAADVRVGVEDAVAGRAGRLVERRARVGDDDDALRGVDAGVAERLLVDAALAVGLDRRAGLRRDDERRCARAGRRARRATWPGSVESSTVSVDARRARDDLGRERRAAHARRARCGRRPRPASSSRSARISGTSGRETATASVQPRRFGASASAVGTPEGGVLRGDAARRPGRRRARARCGATASACAAQVDAGSSSAAFAPSSAARDGVEQLVPGDDELLDALVLEQLR